MSDLGLSCPFGGDFHVCKDSKIRFIGCCMTDPCVDGSGKCNDLLASSFDDDQFDEIGKQSCDDDNSSWYTCISDDVLEHSFMGCCAINACQGQCHGKSLSAASLSANDTAAEVFLSWNTTQATPTASPTASTSMVTPSAPPSTADATTTSSSALSAGAIIGISIGGALAITAVVAGLIFWIRRASRKPDEVREVKGMKPPSITGTNYLPADTHPAGWCPAPAFSAIKPLPAETVTAPRRSVSIRSWISSSLPSRNPSSSSWRASGLSHPPLTPQEPQLPSVAELDGNGTERPVSDLRASELAASGPLIGPSPLLPSSTYRPYRPGF